MRDRTMQRFGMVSFPLAIIVLVISETLHPHSENPNNSVAAFEEYARSSDWIAVHALELLGFLLLIGGWVAVFTTLGTRAAAAAWARLAVGLSLVTGASFVILQAVDGVALKRAADAWASAPPPHREVALAAAQTVRWLELALNSAAYSLTGLTLLVGGVVSGTPAAPGLR